MSEGVLPTECAHHLLPLFVRQFLAFIQFSPSEELLPNLDEVVEGRSMTLKGSDLVVVPQIVLHHGGHGELQDSHHDLNGREEDLLCEGNLTLRVLGLDSLGVDRPSCTGNLVRAEGTTIVVDQFQKAGDSLARLLALDLSCDEDECREIASLVESGAVGRIGSLLVAPSGEGNCPEVVPDSLIVLGACSEGSSLVERRKTVGTLSCGLDSTVLLRRDPHAGEIRGEKTAGSFH